ncbi:hypothetical protein NL676_017627 [Syzygium grande]|nr:hypothetical protein NL676_017627 [Syzygium grande]
MAIGLRTTSSDAGGIYCLSGTVQVALREGRLEEQRASRSPAGCRVVEVRLYSEVTRPAVDGNAHGKRDDGAVSRGFRRGDRPQKNSPEPSSASQGQPSSQGVAFAEVCTAFAAGFNFGFSAAFLFTHPTAALGLAAAAAFALGAAAFDQKEKKNCPLPTSSLSSLLLPKNCDNPKLLSRGGSASASLPFERARGGLNVLRRRRRGTAA